MTMPLESLPKPLKAALGAALGTLAVGGPLVALHHNNAPNTPVAAAPATPELPATVSTATESQPATTTVERTTTIIKTVEAATPAPAVQTTETGNTTPNEANHDQPTAKHKSKSEHKSSGAETHGKAKDGRNKGTEQGKDKYGDDDWGDEGYRDDGKDDWGDEDDDGYGGGKGKQPGSTGGQQDPEGSGELPAEPGGDTEPATPEQPTVPGINPEYASTFSNEFFSKSPDSPHGLIAGDAEIYSKDGGFSINNAPYRFFESDEDGEPTLLLGYPSPKVSPRDPNSLQFVSFTGEEQIGSLIILGSADGQPAKLDVSVGALQESDSNSYFLGADGKKMGQTDAYNTSADRAAYHFVQQEEGGWGLEPLPVAPKG